jgi:hypothetical protein
MCISMPESLHHFVHLFVRIFLCSAFFLGTSAGGLGAQIITILTTELHGGFFKISAWRANWRGGLQRALITLVVVWAVTFGICTMTTVYDDHQALVSKVAKLQNAPRPICPPLSPVVAPKEANIKLMYDTSPLEGKIVNVQARWMTTDGKRVPNGSLSFEIPKLYVKNFGDKETDMFTSRLYFSKSVQSIGPWSNQDSEEHGFVSSAYSAGSDAPMVPFVSPQERVPLMVFHGSVSGCMLEKTMLVRVKVFYGVEKPAVATFRVHFTEVK